MVDVVACRCYKCPSVVLGNMSVGLSVICIWEVWGVVCLAHVNRVWVHRDLVGPGGEVVFLEI